MFMILLVRPVGSLAVDVHITAVTSTQQIIKTVKQAARYS